MGIVIPFVPRTKPGLPAAPEAVCAVDPMEAEAALLAAAQAGSDLATVLAAACPLIAYCRERHGFSVMRDGVPADPKILASALTSLVRALAILEGEIANGKRRRGYAVYLGRQDLSWFEDGRGGMRALAVPAGVEPSAIAHFLRPRLTDATLSARHGRDARLGADDPTG